MPGVHPGVDAVPVQNSFYNVTGMVTLSNLTAYERVGVLLFDQDWRRSELVRTVRARRNDATEVGASPDCARERC